MVVAIWVIVLAFFLFFLSALLSQYVCMFTPQTLVNKHVSTCGNFHHTKCTAVLYMDDRHIKGQGMTSHQKR